MDQCEATARSLKRLFLRLFFAIFLGVFSGEGLSLVPAKKLTTAKFAKKHRKDRKEDLAECPSTSLRAASSVRLQKRLPSGCRRAKRETSGNSNGTASLSFCTKLQAVLVKSLHENETRPAQHIFLPAAFRHCFVCARENFSIREPGADASDGMELVEQVRLQCQR